MKTKTLHLSRGLTLMVTPKHKLLCFAPGVKEHSRAAFEMWRVNTDDRLREIISLRLVTKGD